MIWREKDFRFLSIQAQDFIEDSHHSGGPSARTFLSIQAQDFIEDLKSFVDMSIGFPIPEHSSSGLH